MTSMQKVVSVYERTDVVTKELKNKCHDYKNGGYRLESTVLTTTTSVPFALLDCGHTRMQHPHERFTGSLRLSCHYCDQIQHTAHNLVKCQPERRASWLDHQEYAEQSSKDNLALAARHHQESNQRKSHD